MITDKIILSTLFEYNKIGNMPLTATEIWQWQIDKLGKQTKISLYDIRKELKNLIQQSQVLESNGFYSVNSNQGNFYNTRIHNIATTGHKWKSIQRRTSFIKHIPFIRSIRVIGSVSTANADINSDIDISIGSSKGYVWTVRFFVLFIASIFGVRRTKNKKRDKLCFNHYLGCSGAKINPNNDIGKRIVHKTLLHLQNHSLVLWEKDRNNTIPNISNGNSVLFFIKNAIEMFFRDTRIGKFFERVIGRVQINHINSKNLYSNNLPPLSINSQHIIFAHNKIS